MNAAGQDSWLRTHPWAARILVLFLCLLFLEGATRILVYAGLLPYKSYPTTPGAPRFWGFTDPVVGIWRYPNATFVHEEACIHAGYRTNSDGARDRERVHQSSASRRVVVLGDSFVEGYGFDVDGRFTELLEAGTGVEFLNFGTSGGFGTIQEWLLYTSRVRPYEHSDVVLFINPANDFRDNDPREFAADVYRPFLRRTDTGYEVYYPVAWDERDTGARDRGTVARNVWLNNVYLANVLRWGKGELKDRTKAQRNRFKVAHYERYTPADLDVLLFVLDQLARAAGDRRVWLLTIPTEVDFDVARRDGYRFRLPGILAEFAAQHPNVAYLDLLPAFLHDAESSGLRYSDYTIPCDNHWGARGHALVADVVQRWMFAGN